ALELPRAVPLGARREEERRQGQPALGAADEDVLAGAARRPRRDLEAGLAEEDALVEPVEHRVFAVDVGLRAFVRDPPGDVDPLGSDERALADESSVAVR